MPGDPSDVDLRTILDRLSSTHENPVTRTRRLVELQVPLSRRGPGWDRHWRELEAYLETPGHWAGENGASGTEPHADDAT